MRWLVALCLMIPNLLAAQGVATLVADSVVLTPGGDQLIAQGNIEVFYDGTTLTAERITYDRNTDRLILDGPILITNADGAIFTADSGDIDPQLGNGILRSARLVLNEQLQLGASEINRVGGRYSQLSQVAVTSCRICATGETPLWEIRARRIVHDEAEQQLYFDDATFRIMGVPVFYIPQMRLPDPTLTRSTGLLIPRLRSTDNLATGIKLPYFIRLGDHRDLTLTPYLSTSTTTLEAVYRQAFVDGNLEVDGALSNDDLTDDLRAYVFADGIFDLGQDVILRFDVEYTSDDTYLLEYGYSDKDRLDSELSLERVRDRDLTRVRLTYFSSLRAGEDSATLPPLLADVQWERRRAAQIGGTLTYTGDLQAHYRQTNTPTVGRDVARLGLGTMWQYGTTTNRGLVLSSVAGLDLDAYAIGDDPNANTTLRATAYAATTLRYPLIRRTSDATHVLEPVVQLTWSEVNGDDVPNEDSNATEFDEANLFALSRFSGEDAVETGARAALGLTWTRLGMGGWDSTLTLGRVVRDASNPGFATSSGFSSSVSDWLLAGQLRTPEGLSIDGRVVFDPGFDVTKSEIRGGWSGDRLDLAATYIFLPADAAEGRANDVSEWTIDADYTFNDVWSAGFDARYDVIADGPSRTGLDIGWQNECVTVDFSVSRRFTSSSTLEPSTDFGLSIGLKGFGTGPGVDIPTHRCTH